MIDKLYKKPLELFCKFLNHVQTLKLAMKRKNIENCITESMTLIR